MTDWDPQHLDYARSHLWAVLATGRADGSPQQSMIGYLVDDEGRLLIAYSGGLHHVQSPGQRVPKIFKKLFVRFENLDLVAYREEMRERHGAAAFRSTVIADLEAQRDRHCVPG